MTDRERREGKVLSFIKPSEDALPTARYIAHRAGWNIPYPEMWPAREYFVWNGLTHDSLSSLTLRISHVFFETVIQTHRELEGGNSYEWLLNENFCDMVELHLKKTSQTVDMVDPQVCLIEQAGETKGGFLSLHLYFDDGAWWNEQSVPKGPAELPFRRESQINKSKSRAWGWSVDQGINFLKKLKESIDVAVPLISGRSAPVPPVGSPVNPRYFEIP